MRLLYFWRNVEEILLVIFFLLYVPFAQSIYGVIRSSQTGPISHLDDLKLFLRSPKFGVGFTKTYKNAEIQWVKNAHTELFIYTDRGGTMIEPVDLMPHFPLKLADLHALVQSKGFEMLNSRSAVVLEAAVETKAEAPVEVEQRQLPESNQLVINDENKPPEKSGQLPIENQLEKYDENDHSREEDQLSKGNQLEAKDENEHTSKVDQLEVNQLEKKDENEHSSKQQEKDGTFEIKEEIEKHEDKVQRVAKEGVDPMEMGENIDKKSMKRLQGQLVEKAAEYQKIEESAVEAKPIKRLRGQQVPHDQSEGNDSQVNVDAESKAEKQRELEKEINEIEQKIKSLSEGRIVTNKELKKENNTIVKKEAKRLRGMPMTEAKAGGNGPPKVLLSTPEPTEPCSLCQQELEGKWSLRFVRELFDGSEKANNILLSFVRTVLQWIGAGTCVVLIFLCFRLVCAYKKPAKKTSHQL